MHHIWHNSETQHVIQGHRQIVAASPSFTLGVTLALVVVVFTTPSIATTWAPRLDLGVAAVDRGSGEVRWEAWRMDELPGNASDELQAAAKKLLSANKENYDHGKVPGQTGMPAVLTTTQFVRYEFKDAKHQLILMRGSPKAAGAEIARFARKEYPGWPIVASGGTMYFVHSGRVYAMKPWTGADPPDDGQWSPAWIYDLRTDLNFQEKNRARLYQIGAGVDGGKFWVIHPRGMLLMGHRRVLLKRIFNLVIGSWIIKNASKVIALSRYETEQFKPHRIPPERVQIIPNGVPLEQRGKRDPKPYFLYIGRIESRKNLIFLIQAFQKYRQSGGTQD